jgi:hypothetical protein
MSKYIPSGADVVRQGLIALASVLFVAFILAKFPKLRNLVDQDRGTP